MKAHNYTWLGVLAPESSTLPTCAAVPSKTSTQTPCQRPQVSAHCSFGQASRHKRGKPEGKILT